MQTRHVFQRGFFVKKITLGRNWLNTMQSKGRPGITFHKATCHYHAKWERMGHAKFNAATTSLLTGRKLAIPTPENCSFYTATQHHRNLSAHIKQQVLREAWKLYTVYSKHDSIPGAGCVIFTPAAQLRGVGDWGVEQVRCGGGARECCKVPCSTQMHI